MLATLATLARLSHAARRWLPAASADLNERFTDLADSVSEFVGKWFWSAFSLLLLLVWVVWGILFIRDWFTSQQWNFPLNTITTVGEWFMEGLIAAAANRIERRNREQQDRIETMERTLDEHVNTTAKAHAALLTENARLLTENTTLTREIHTALAARIGGDNAQGQEQAA